MRFKSTLSIALIGLLLFPQALAFPTLGTGTLTSVSDEISNPVPSATGVAHTISFGTVTAAPIDKVEITFHDTGDIPASPANYLAPSATLGTQSVWGTGSTSLTINGSGKEIVLMRTSGAALPTVGQVQVVLQNITNTATQGNYYITIATMNGASYVDSATSVFVINNGLPVNVNVTPQLSISLGDNGIKDNSFDAITDPNITFGALGGTYTSNALSGGGTDGNSISVTTNAQNGYTVSVLDTANGLAKNGATVVPGDRIFDDSSSPVNAAIFDYQNASAPAANTEMFSFQVTGPHPAPGILTFNALTGLVQKTIISFTAPVTNDVHEIMYRAQVHPSTQTGAYSDSITYVVTPSF